MSMTSYSLEDFREILGIPWVGSGMASPALRYFTVDTRRIQFAEQTVFVALKGSKKDGHDYLQEASNKGVRVFFVRENFDARAFGENHFFFKLSNPLKALQRLAEHKRGALHKTRFIGITGSNGKTIVKDWLSQLFSSRHKVGMSPGSYNSQLGVALSLLGLKEELDYAFIEAGISKVGEMTSLSQMIAPEWGILTNIGAAHDEGFVSRRDKVLEKIQLFEHSEWLLINGDDKEVLQIVRECFPKKKLFTFGKEEANDVLLLAVVPQAEHFVIDFGFEGHTYSIQALRGDKIFVYNLLICFAFLAAVGELDVDYCKQFSELRALKNRMEIRRGLYNCLLLNDSYSSDPLGFSLAYQYLMEMRPGARKWLIAADFALQESEFHRDSINQEVGGLIKDQPVEAIVGIGSHIGGLKTYLPEGIPFTLYRDAEDFLRKFDFYHLKDSVVLIKGSRNFGLDRISDYLSIKQHRTVLEVDLSAMTSNLNRIAAGLPKGTKIMVMVKAAAYGVGSIEIAEWLQKQRIDCLGVAYADEGVELRQNGIEIPIMVLNSENSSFEQLLQYNLEPDVFSLEGLKQWVDFLRFKEVENFPIHLEIETGMHRLGLDESAFEEVWALLLSNPKTVRVKSIFSHLAVSEDSDQDAFTWEQAEKLDAFYRMFQSKMGYSPLRHILNSGGILRFPSLSYDMVRLGIGLYGVGEVGDLEETLTLKTHIAQIKELSEGESVGYGRRWVAPKATRIATVNMGYADGLRRDAAAKGLEFMIRGCKVPVIGSVCMDMCMLDISAVEEAEVGDEAILFSPDKPLQELAVKLETIPYEILTGISPRVQRIYINS
jgi:Alr-MurF fusion protein